MNGDDLISHAAEPQVLDAPAELPPEADQGRAPEASASSSTEVAAGCQATERMDKLTKISGNESVSEDICRSVAPDSESSPSPGTPGEGRGEGPSFGGKDAHPNPLPEYRERDQERTDTGTSSLPAFPSAQGSGEDLSSGGTEPHPSPLPEYREREQERSETGTSNAPAFSSAQPVAAAPLPDESGASSDDAAEFDPGDSSLRDDYSSVDGPELDSHSESASDDDDRDTVRQQLLRQFEDWLDRMDQGEPPPEGLPEELLADALETSEPADALGADLYSVFAGLTKLSGEVGLQGRAFRQLADVLAPSTQVPARLDRIEAAQTAVARELARRAEPDKAALPASEEVLAVVFDLYDRLQRGLKNFDESYKAVRSQAHPAGLLQRLIGGKGEADPLAAPAAAMREGYRLTLSRLEAALLQWGIQPTGEVGEPFDPLRMAVVEVESAPGVPDGSVLEVYRSGYVLNGRMLSTARVKVAKAGPSR